MNPSTDLCNKATGWTKYQPPHKFHECLNNPRALQWFFDRFLLRFLSRKRAFALRLWLFRYGGLSLICVISVAALSAWFAWFRVEPHRHMNFETAKVLTTQPASEKLAPLTSFVVELSDGRVLNLTTRQGAILGEITNLACVERRQRLESGTYRFRLVRADYCDSANQKHAQTN